MFGKEMYVLYMHDNIFVAYIYYAMQSKLFLIPFYKPMLVPPTNFLEILTPPLITKS